MTTIKTPQYGDMKWFARFSSSGCYPTPLMNMRIIKWKNQTVNFDF
ncbi:hypothetical protein SeHA_C1589 [Salmonella enterica subsp. enterica serovar Heidelberg str. SL476]|uniref:Uncharacterized protein n=2 Tax=Enterobacterales TaxID=91347 RepID=A0A0B4ZSY7_PROMI|nr:hypothetical protein SeHA_C1589 [Salmonella enterica subsp. enterica serovar Heidelberg str. SL476]AJD76968.1 hypothetical protein [Proteus mirabilis]